MTRVKVIWAYKGHLCADICTLADYDTQLVEYDGTPLPEEISETIQKDGFVMFFDDEGLFCIKADQIKKIEILEN